MILLSITRNTLFYTSSHLPAMCQASYFQRGLLTCHKILSSKIRKIVLIDHRWQQVHVNTFIHMEKWTMTGNIWIKHMVHFFRIFCFHWQIYINYSNWWYIVLNSNYYRHLIVSSMQLLSKASKTFTHNKTYAVYNRKT